jgi:hypothetical protein
MIALAGAEACYDPFSVIALQEPVSMGRSGRRRRVLKWAGLGLLLVIAATWTASLWWGSRYERKRLPPYDHCIYLFVISNGRITCVNQLGMLSGLHYPSGWHIFRHEPHPEWGLTIRYRTDRWLDRRIFLPLWVPFALVAIPTAILWWRDRRRIPPGHCRNCGYNLTGNVSGICPECGAEIDRSAPLG